MSRRILSQQEMQRSRDGVGFCYLCGAALPPREAGWKKTLTGEHVVPRDLLGQPPVDARHRWAVELYVHRACESAAKQGADHLLNLLQTINVTPVTDWPEWGHVKNLNLELKLLRVRATTDLITAAGNAEPVLRGARTWVRGLHTALYGGFLPDDALKSVLPPVPACGTKGGPSMDDAETYSRVIRSAIALAYSRDKWDGVDAWGAQLQFRCVWKYVPAEYGGPIWWCLWGLVFPGVLDWSRTVLPRGAERPWHGSYVMDHLPDGASALESEDFPR